MQKKLPRILAPLVLSTALLATAVFAADTPASAPAATPENPALVPTPRHRWMDSHNEQVAEANKIDPDVIFMGDSITAGWMNPGRQIWNRYFKPLKSADIAIAGDTIENLLWRVENGGIGGKLRPKVVVLMIGTNNGRETAVQIAEGVGNLIHEIQVRSPGTKVLLQAILPRGEKPNKWRAKNDEANKLLAAMADNKHIWYVDFGPKFLEPDGTIPEKLMPGFLHPNEAGYALWAEAIEPLLNQLLR